MSKLLAFEFDMGRLQILKIVPQRGNEVNSGKYSSGDLLRLLISIMKTTTHQLTYFPS